MQTEKGSRTSEKKGTSEKKSDSGWSGNAEEQQELNKVTNILCWKSFLEGQFAQKNFKSKNYSKNFKSKLEACLCNAGLCMACKYHISFATDLAANLGFLLKQPLGVMTVMPNETVLVKNFF